MSRRTVERRPAGGRAQGRLRGLGRLAHATLAAFQADGCHALSAAMVYYSTLSTVPLVFLVISLPVLILYTQDPAGTDEFVQTMGKIAGPLFGDVVVNFLERIQRQSQVAVVASMAMLLFSASAGFRFLRYAFRWIWRDNHDRVAAFHVAQVRATVLRRALDFLIAFGMVLLAPLAVTLGLLLFGLSMFARLKLQDVPLIGDAVGSLLPPTALLALYAGIYIGLLWTMPPVRLRLREIWLPGLVCAVAVLLTTYGLSFYIRYFSGTSLYGAIGTLFAIQLWTYANAVALFVSAELCKLGARDD
jgi:membrane protein